MMMKTTLHRRLVLLACLTVLSSVVLATGAQVVLAMRDTGRTSVSSTTTSTTAVQGGGQAQKRFIGPTIEAAKLGLATAAEGKLNTGQPVNAQEWAASEHALTAAAGTQGRGGVNAPSVAAASGQQAAPSGTTSPASTSSRTTWIIVGSALAALIVVVAAWAVMRRRRPGELAPATSNGSASEAFCAQHPDDALCRSA
jgi:hypothetical protein